MTFTEYFSEVGQALSPASLPKAQIAALWGGRSCRLPSRRLSVGQDGILQAGCQPAFSEPAH